MRADEIHFVVTTHGDEVVSHRSFTVVAADYEAHITKLRDARIPAYPLTRFPAYPVTPMVFDGSHIEVTIHGEHAQLSASWWTCAPEGYDALDEFVDWMWRVSGDS